MPKSAIPGLHLVRYGTPADQKYLLGELLDTYDQLVINANMVAHAPAALTSFLTQRTKNKPYFIDPLTHAFQHDIGNLQSQGSQTAGQIKRSVQNLLKRYGEPVQSRVGIQRASILPEDFRQGSTRRRFCERVIQFQTDALASEAKSSDSAKYYTFLKKKGVALTDNFGPSLVIAPYFYLEASTYQRWLPVNLAFAADADAIAREHKQPLGIQIVLDRDLLASPDALLRVADDYAKTSADVFLIWIDSFSEQDASPSQLSTFVRFLTKINEGADVVNLYGGYLSVALARSGRVARLRGVTHGLEYGEERSVIPVGGGLPVPKFYLPPLHMRLPARDAFRAIRELGGFASKSAFHRRVCECPECQTVIQTEPEKDFLEYGKTRAIATARRVVEYPLPETKLHCVRHYMWCKQLEYRGPFSLSSLISQLRDSEKRLSRTLGLSSVAHCRTWADLLQAENPQV